MIMVAIVAEPPARYTRAMKGPVLGRAPFVGYLPGPAYPVQVVVVVGVPPIDVVVVVGVPPIDVVVVVGVPPIDVVVVVGVPPIDVVVLLIVSRGHLPLRSQGWFLRWRR